MNTLLNFLMVLSWLAIVANAISWAITIYTVAKEPNLVYFIKAGKLDVAMVLGIAFLVAKALT